MTSDRALLVAIWTVYIFLGSYLKDLRLIHYVGDAYREYRAGVPAYVRMARSRAAVRM
jgi:protein-S-isoprenylcysteine O-methyltransferase Ste14